MEFVSAKYAIICPLQQLREKTPTVGAADIQFIPRNSTLEKLFWVCYKSSPNIIFKEMVGSSQHCDTVYHGIVKKMVSPF